jgi:uncharacterized protein (UPF0261 family)
MTVSIEELIIKKMKKAKRGSLFFAEDFLRFGSSKSAAKALERLVDKEKILRVARGIYTRPETDPVLGIIMPSAEEIAKAIAKRDKARIIPTGVLALHALGLSEQTPCSLTNPFVRVM